MASVGTIEIDVDVSKQKAEKSLDDLKKNIDEFGKGVEDSANVDLSKMTNDLDKAATAFEKAKIKSQELKSQLQSIEDIDIRIPKIGEEIKAIQEGMQIDQELFKSGDIDYTDLFQSTERAKADIAELNAELDKLSQQRAKAKSVESLKLDLEQANSAMDGQAIKMDMIASKADKISSSIKPVPKDMQKADTETKKMSGSMSAASGAAKSMGDSVSNGVNKIVKYGLALFSIRSIYGALRNLSNEWLNSDQAAAQQVQANIGAIKSALANSLAPVITWLADLVMTVVGYANALLKAFFGVDLFAKSTSKNVNKGIGGGLKNANKELKKFKANFDEAEVISSNIADNLGGGGGGHDELPTPKIPTPDISGFVAAIEKIKQIWESIWSLPVVKAMWNLITTAFTVFGQSLLSIGSNYLDNYVMLFNAMLPDLQRGMQNLLDFWTLVFNDMANFIEVWVPIITESFNTLVDSLFITLTPLFVWLSQAWADITGYMLETWKKYGADILDEIGKFINGMIVTFTLIWTDIIDPIIRPALEELQRLWDEHLKGIVSDVIDFVGELVLRFLEVWNNAIQPFIDKVVKVLGPVVSATFKMLWSVVGGVLESIAVVFSQVWNGIKQQLRGLLDFIEGVFTGNWRQAWQGLANIVGGIFNGMIGIVKAPLNAIIGIINGFIRGLNRIKIPSWVPVIGGGGINIPQIPYLASGGVLTQPTLNVAGEYPNAHRNPEIVTPENKMREAMADVLSQYGGGGTGNITIQLVTDGRILAETVVKQEQINELQMNGGVG